MKSRNLTPVSMCSASVQVLSEGNLTPASVQTVLISNPEHEAVDVMSSVRTETGQRGVSGDVTAVGPWRRGVKGGKGQSWSVWLLPVCGIGNGEKYHGTQRWNAEPPQVSVEMNTFLCWRLQSDLKSVLDMQSKHRQLHHLHSTVTANFNISP